MNLKRGFFRLWVTAAALWIAAATWIAWDDLLGQPWTISWGSAEPTTHSLSAAALIVLPPIAVLFLGYMSTWVARGFRH